MMDLVGAWHVDTDLILSRLICLGIRGAALLAGIAFVVWFGGNEVARFIRIWRQAKARILDAFRQ